MSVVLERLLSKLNSRFTVLLFSGDTYIYIYVYMYIYIHVPGNKNYPRIFSSLMDFFFFQERTFSVRSKGWLIR